MRLAENEILQPICCGLLESKDEVAVSIFSSELGPKDIEEIEVCVEPHRLILAGKKSTNFGSAQAAPAYRVLPLKDEFDPSSAKLTLKKHGSLLEIKIHKAGKKSLLENRAA
ncbi:MAG: Hsp20/alpha crystallin family protein [Candidatus Acidiferrales bacterium]